MSEVKAPNMVPQWSPIVALSSASCQKDLSEYCFGAGVASGALEHLSYSIVAYYDRFCLI